MRNISDHLEGAIEQSRRCVRYTVKQPKGKSDASAECESGSCARGADRNVMEQFSAASHPYRRR
jgi:hypothetical protein